MYVAADVFELLDCHHQEFKLDHLIELKAKRHWRSWWMWVWVEGDDHEGFEVDRGSWIQWIWHHFVWGNWLKWTVIIRQGMNRVNACYEKIKVKSSCCLARLPSLISWSHLQCLVHRHMYCWTLGMTVQMAGPQFKQVGGCARAHPPTHETACINAWKTYHIKLHVQWGLLDDEHTIFETCRRQEELDWNINMKSEICWLTLRNAEKCP
jgi:hypothetical protein